MQIQCDALRRCLSIARCLADADKRTPEDTVRLNKVHRDAQEALFNLQCFFKNMRDDMEELSRAQAAAQALLLMQRGIDQLEGLLETMQADR